MMNHKLSSLCLFFSASKNAVGRGKKLKETGRSHKKRKRIGKIMKKLERVGKRWNDGRNWK